jgi:peptidoglycan-N-acetylglucosamine deacetylase
VEQNKSFGWSQGILLAFLGVVGCLSLGLILPIVFSLSNGKSKQNVDVKDATANLGTQERVENFKTTMLNTWQLEARIRGFAYVLPARFQGVTLSEAKLTKGDKVIALTFDDGPRQGSTEKILDILKQNDIKGTFFIVGQMLQEYPNLGKRIVAENHVIANHTWHHWYHHMSPQIAANEIDRTTDLIYKTTGVKTTMFRPPGGIMHNGVADYARNRKYGIILWSSDSNDYTRPAVPRLVSNVMREARPGGIVLMHDGGGDRSHTVAALPQIISNFRKQGYKFVTVPELLEIQDQEQKTMTAKK